MARSAPSRSIRDGHVAAATSTGGLTAKRWGRIGDSPLIGAGTYADDRACAVSATGLGEAFIRAVAGHQLAMRMMLSGETLQQALDAVLADVGSLGGTGGLIAVAPIGRSGVGLHHARHVSRVARSAGAARGRGLRRAVGKRRAAPR